MRNEFYGQLVSVDIPVDNEDNSGRIEQSAKCGQAIGRRPQVAAGCDRRVAILISQKCQYALRAVFELTCRYGQGPIRIPDIAQVQAIPPRFLEVILNQLKQGGFVQSRRGKEGGYLLADKPARLTVGQIIRFIQGPLGPVSCLTESDVPNSNANANGNAKSSVDANQVFMPMWRKVQAAMEDVYDSTTFADLVEAQGKNYVPSYNI